MADFKTHVSFGIALGILGTIGIVSVSLSSGPGLLLAAFVAATLGSVLPDIDSDSGVPYHVTFGSLALVAGALAFAEYSRYGAVDWRSFLYYAVGTAVFVWIVVGTVFKHFTKHRGMAHSIPAAILTGLCTFMLCSRFAFDDTDAFLIGSAASIGYLIHLVLDEVYAATNFNGVIFSPSRSLGSALKLFSNSLITNIVMYGTIVYLCSVNFLRLRTLYVFFMARFI
jgi:membrane-bound metal-dependent hydrolase YbcI (DUF457 family)